jgi:hypothetical protein
VSRPQEAEKVKLISSLFSPQIKLIDAGIKEMEEQFGHVDWASEIMPFDRTRYYEKEMGWPLYRRFISFIELIVPESLADIKLITNDLEKAHLCEGKRIINIDPGYMALERLVLGTGKNYSHRLYLSKGIYADLTLIFHDRTFKPLSWTYPDYADEKVIGIFNTLRSGYLKHLREGA